MYVLTGRPGEALVACDQVLAFAADRDQDHPQARFIKARALHEMGRNREALVEIDLTLIMLGAEAEAMGLRERILKSAASSTTGPKRENP